MALPKGLSAAIYGVAAEALTVEEVAFFKDVKPYGFILFKRNCSTPEQVRALTDSLRSLAGHEEVPILIDQEGGRVARLAEPHWWKPPAAADLANLVKRHNLEVAEHAVYLNARLIAAQLAGLGITVDCAPLADIPAPNSHDIIGDRAYGKAPRQVALLAGAMARGLHDGGVISVLKHIPGHGRAMVDSHEDLPVVHASLEELQDSDFAPFHSLRDLPMGMTAHIIYEALDKDAVATTSPTVIRYIREEIGFDGLLMSDDLSMKALKGDFAARARDTLAAGCDVVLHCNGKMEEMQQVAKGVAVMTAEAEIRADRAWNTARRDTKADGMDIAAAQAEIASLLAA